MLWTPCPTHREQVSTATNPSPAEEDHGPSVENKTALKIAYVPVFSEDLVPLLVMLRRAGGCGGIPTF